MSQNEKDQAARQPPVWRRHARLAGVVLLVAAAFAWALWPRAVAVDLAAVTTGPMTVRIEEEARTRIKDVFVVSTPQAGIMLRSPRLAGDPVVKGKTIIAVLQPAQPPFLDLRTRLEVMAQAKAAKAAVDLAYAELVQARADLAFAEAELERTKKLASTSTAAPRTLEKAEHEAEIARAALTKSEANVAVKRRQLESVEARLVDPDDETIGGIVEAACCVEVRSPVSGRVLRVHQTSEQVLPAGTPLAEVGDPKQIEIVVELLSSDAVKVREGAKVDLDGWGGGEVLNGTVRRIEAAGFTKVSALGIEEQRVRVIVDLDKESLEKHRLGHEFRVMAHLHVWESDSVTRVPVGALFRNRGDWAVFRMEGGRARLTKVRLDHRNGDFAEVLEGLKPGDRVVLHPSDRVAEGVRVAAREAAAD